MEKFARHHNFSKGTVIVPSHGASVVGRTGCLEKPFPFFLPVRGAAKTLHAASLTGYR